MRGLMMGRFQPFHLGHLNLVKQILSECDEIIIAITSAQFNHMEKDPFTLGERIEMIHSSLKNEIDMSKCFIIGVENQPNMVMWVPYLHTILPPFDKVYSGNEYVVMLFKKVSIQVIQPNFLDVKKYNASNIRKMIISDESWTSLVPRAVASIIHRIDGKNRIATILNSDTRPNEY